MKRLILILSVFFTTILLNGFSGHIITNTTWSSDIIITGDTWIDEGATLTINAGITVFFPKIDANADNIGDIDFIINGRLLTQGTPSNKVIFTSLETDPQPDDWGGIDYLHTLSQNSNLQYTDVLYAYQGIHINGKLFTLNHGTIQECGNYGIRVENSHGETTSLNNITIFENGYYGLKVETSGIVNGSGVLISSNISHGFWISGTSNASFTNSRSVSNGGNGVYIVNASPSFSNTFINSNSVNGVEIESAGSNPSFDNCSIESNYANGFLFQDGCTGTVEYSNVLNNLQVGIMVLNNSLPTINYCNIYDNCSETVLITESIPSNELYLLNSNSYSSYYSIMFPISMIDQIHVSGYGDHNSSGDDYLFRVYNTSSYIYEYNNPNSYYDTSFDLWANITSNSSDQQLRVYLNTYSVSSFWGRVSEIKYDPMQAQLLTSNSSGVIDAGHNWWGQITGVDSLITQSVPGTVNYGTMEIQYISTAGASYTNIAPEFTLLAPDSMLVNPTNVMLSWLDMDVDDDALISLYYDDGLNQAGTLIIEDISEDSITDHYLWDLVGVPYALYYIYGIIDDGVNAPIVSYASGQVMVGPVTASSPDDSHGAAGEQVSVPINVANTYDYFGIISFQFILNFDNLLLTANSVETAGTLSDGWTVNNDTSIPGQITVNGFSANELIEGGTLLEIVFDVDAGALDYEDCIMNISTFEFNNGNVTVEIDDGLFTVLNEYTISGEIEYYSNAEPVEFVSLLLSGTEADSTDTNEFGAYSFPLHIAGNYELTPSCMEEIPQLVIAPFDASLVARYALGLETFNSNQITAGDVNNDLETTVYDAALIAQYSVELITEFEAGIWKFSPESFSFELTGNNEIVDYDAIVIGDPSGNWAAPVREMNENIHWEVTTELRDDENILILSAYYSEPFVSSFAKLEFEPHLLEFSEIIIEDVISDFQVFSQETENSIILGSYGVNYVRTDQKIFSIEFNVLSNITNLEEAVNCKFLLFDEEVGELIFPTGSNNNIVVPLQYTLQQNYPNPFNPQTRIVFSLPNDVHTKLEIFNVKGQKVQTLISEKLEKGNHVIIWEADKFASGIYFYKIEAGEFSKIKKMVLMK